MPLQDILQTEKEPHALAFNKYIYAVLITLQVIIAYFIYHEFSINQRVALMDALNIRMIAEINHTVNVGHYILWGKIMADKSSINREASLAFLDEAEKLAKAMLQDDTSREVMFSAIDNPQMRSQIGKLQSIIATYRDTAIATLATITPSHSSAGSIAPLNKIFNEFVTQTEKVDMYFEQILQMALKDFDDTRKILFICYIVFTLALITIFYLFERRKAFDLLRIQNARMAAEKKEQWLRVTMRSMGDGLITTDTSANVTYINPVASSLTGWNADEAIGKDIHAIFNIVNEKTRKPVINPVKEVLRRKYIVGLANHTVLISKAGNQYPIADSGAPILDNKGDCIGTVLVFHDVSDRVEAEKQLRNARQEWERSFNAIKDLITIQNKDMRITRANTAACAIFNAKEEDLIGRYCYEIFTGKNEPCSACPIIEGDQEIFHHETILKNKILGKTFQVSIAPVFDEKYELEYFVHSARDVTEKARLEMDLMQARKMEAIGTLAGGIAHDFNNILSVIQGYTGLAAETAKLSGEDPKLIEYLNNVEIASQRATELVQQILTFSRKSNDAQIGPIDPHLIVKESLKLIRAFLPKSIDLQTDIGRRCGTITGDPTKIQQVVMNLCTNAAQAMEHEIGVLRVKLSRVELSEDQITGDTNVVPGPFIELSVADSGSGIDRATLEHIFEPYFTTKKLGKGTGMGLAMVHGIISEYRGMITVKSEVGQGTTFKAYFPALTREKIIPKEGLEEIPGGDERIIVVDDEELIVGFHKTILKKLGYHVTGYTNSLSAFEKLKAEPDNFDLIITDQSMPKMTGKEFAQKTLAIRPAMPIILLSGFSSMISEKEAKAIGIREFAMKPISRSQIANLIRKVLDTK